MNEVDKFGLRTIDAIDQLAKANRYEQALIVLYSAIDTLAWVSIKSGDVTREIFCKWVDKYINPEKLIHCTAKDLYSARCAIVHSSTAESRMSREGQAREIWYVTDATKAERLQEYARTNGSKAHVMPFTWLLFAFTEGAMNFSADLTKDAEFENRCVERMKYWLRFVKIHIESED